MAITKAAYDEQLAFLLRLNAESVITRMHVGYGGAVQKTFDHLLGEAPETGMRGTDAELWARVTKARDAWFVRGLTFPFITTPIKEQATESIEAFLHLARQYLEQEF